MARTADGAALTDQHRSQQLSLRAAMLRDLVLLWPLWRPGQVSTFSRFAELASVLITARHRDSAALAAAYLRAFRRAEGVADGPVRLAERLPRDEVVTSLRATGLAGVMRAIRGGFSPQAAARSGLVQVSGSAGRLVQSGGRDTITSSMRADRQARGWQRITDGSPCAFCAMIASRGPVFTTQRSGGFEAHDHCACTAEPFYDGSRVPEANQRFEQLWIESTRGLSGREARIAFRRAIEGRT